MAGLTSCIRKLEKLSLLTCSKDVQILLERKLKNVEPILKVEAQDVKPLIWQNELNLDRLHNDKPEIRLKLKDVEANASRVFEDYVSVGKLPRNS